MLNQAYTPGFLNHQRTQGDAVADEFLATAFKNNEAKAALYQWLNQLTYNHQLDALPEAYIHQPVIMQANRLPAFANAKQMRAGTAFFARHAQVIMNLLGLLSLPYCYASANGAQVLCLSDRIKADTGKRLAETAEFVWDVMAPNAFEPEGRGLVSCLKIRLMHAAARYYSYKSGRWNDDWGIPVNQEDMAGTNLSFSLLVIRGLRKFGYAVAYADQQAFMHLWNVIGSLLGVEKSMLPADGKQANQLEEAIRLHQFKPSNEGQELTASLIQHFSSVSNAYFSTGEVLQLMRYLLGDEISAMIGIDAEPLSAVRVRLLQAMQLVNELKVPSDTRSAYQEEYRKFKKAMPLQSNLHTKHHYEKKQ